jgi:hypothetical protein
MQLLTYVLPSSPSLKISDGYRLLPSASDIGFFAKYADASAIGSCATVIIGVCRWYVCTYVYKEHVATEDVGLGLYVGSSSQAAGAGSRRRLACAFT